MLEHGAERPTAVVDRRCPSPSSATFEHDGIVAIAADVAFDIVRGHRVIVVHAVSPHRFGQKTIGVLAARISAFVIAGTLEHVLPRVPVELYLRYPGRIDLAIDADLVKTAQRIERRREYLHHLGRISIREEPQTIPAQVLAYVPATTSRDAREAYPQADLRTRCESERLDCRHTPIARVRGGQEHVD